MEEIDISLIARRSIQGIFALISRTFFIQIVTLVSNFFLAIYLSPEVFGVFFLVSAFMAFLTYFSDIGLAAALIQKKEKISSSDLATTFTIQQLLVLAIVLIGFLVSPVISSFYNLNQNGIQLFWALLLAFFLSSLKTIPSILLERDLRFDKLIIPQVVETLAFNIAAVYFAIVGYGVFAFTIAVLLRGISGLFTMYMVAPWKPKVGFSKDSAKHLLSFGIPFQTNSILALLKDEVIKLYLGKVLPLSQVGYIGFAEKWAFTPLRLIMDNIIRITFPSFSRLQHDKEALATAIEKSLFVSALIIFPALTGLVILSPYFIDLIPQYQKWEPALLSLLFFAINAAFSSVSTPLTNTLNAIGKIHITLKLMIFWTAATWILTPIAIATFGYNGFSMASAIIATSAIVVVIIVKRFVPFSLFQTIFSPILASSVMGLSLYFLSPIVLKDIISLISMIGFGAIVYFVTMYILAKKQIKDDIALLMANLRK